eukprot:9169002-Lingulodinium_polyedra.AAC.1
MQYAKCYATSVSICGDVALIVVRHRGAGRNFNIGWYRIGHHGWSIYGPAGRVERQSLYGPKEHLYSPSQNLYSLKYNLYSLKSNLYSLK